MDLRLFLEDVCCDLCRFHHVSNGGFSPEDVRIRQEVHLGIAEAYADIQITPGDHSPYFVEVKWGLAPELLVDRMAHKYGQLTDVTRRATKIILVYDTSSYSDWPAIESQIRARVPSSLEIEVWGLDQLRASVKAHFGLEFGEADVEHLLLVRTAIERRKGEYAFGSAYSSSPLQTSLMWHLSFWALKNLQQSRGSAQAILPAGRYGDVVVVIADLSSFSSYVRDTRDESVVRHILTAFYAKARRQVLNLRGMLSQFVGDAVIAAFGVPEGWSTAAEDALECATALLDLGASISNEWQRCIDRVQGAAGCHIGIAMGDLHVVPLRAFSRAHMGVVADAVNMAARLATAASPGEIVVSNAFYRGLGAKSQYRFREMETLEAHNVGRLRAWKTLPRSVQAGAH